MSAQAIDIEKVFQDSETFAGNLLSLIDLPLCNDSERVRVSDTLCSLSLQHWTAIRALLGTALFPSAVVIHRAQFEAAVRSIWVAYGATDHQLSRLNAADLNPETEQAAKNLPQVQEMMEVIAKKGPPQAHDALQRFMNHSWRALNSYTHSGIHPIKRHDEGYPVGLVLSALANSNGLGVIAGMHAVGLSGMQPMQRQILDLARQYIHCMPPPLAEPAPV